MTACVLLGIYTSCKHIKGSQCCADTPVWLPEPVLWRGRAWALIPGLPLASTVLLGKPSNVSVPRFIV